MDQISFHPRVGSEVLDLVARLEGFRARATALADGRFVIGHGHVRAADPGRAIDAHEARALLHYDLSNLAGVIEPLLLAPVSPRQFDALLSFAFAVGPEAFASSLVLRRLNAGASLDAAAAMELWRVGEVDGEAWVVDAFVRRRAAEKARFLEPPAGFAAPPSAVLRPRLDTTALEAFEAEPKAATVARVETFNGHMEIAHEPAPSLALATVAAVSARLDRLFAPEPPPPPVVPDEGAAHPADLAGDAEAPAPSDPPAAANELGDAKTLSAAPSDVEARAPRVSPPSFFGPALLMGLVGLAVFAWAVLRIYKAPSLGSLALGVLGVAAMAPAAMRLTTPRRRDDG